MAIVVDEVDVETVDTRGADVSASDTRPPPRVPPDMDRICLELRREAARLERLWTD